MKTDKNTFNLIMEEQSFSKGDVLSTEDTELEVLDIPKKRDRWWEKILRFLTFGQFFRPSWSYTVKILVSDGT